MSHIEDRKLLVWILPRILLNKHISTHTHGCTFVCESLQGREPLLHKQKQRDAKMSCQVAIGIQASMWV